MVRASASWSTSSPTTRGQWLIHCHNAYHLATGMATVLSYRNRS
ncbi:MAG: multicopper oxidase domain-containing protein [Actinophytocola sp.]|nr:multicopper oxidase domain-containing protein [Actinophytocola sp.]